jgi:hypothetical protein
LESSREINKGAVWDYRVVFGVETRDVGIGRARLRDIVSVETSRARRYTAGSLICLEEANIALGTRILIVRVADFTEGMAWPTVFVLVCVVPLGARHVVHASLFSLEQFSVTLARSAAPVSRPIAIAAVGMASSAVIEP